jgi:hypothetical protein
LLDDRPRSQINVRALLAGSGPAQAKPHLVDLPADEQAIPQPGDSYVAHARPANKPLPMFHFLLKDGGCEGFSYFHLSRLRMIVPDSPGASPMLLVRVIDGGVFEVEIEGRNLTRIYEYLGQHRLSWVRELDTSQDVEDEGATVVTRITIRIVKDDA